jgi:glycosyltransferase involved in cell wall biosynthesis
VARRILQIIPTLDRSGAEKQLALLAANLPRDEFEVHVAVLTRTGPLEAELAAAGIPVTLIGKRWKIDPSAFARLRRTIQRLQPDLIQTWLFAANAYGRAAGQRAGVKRLVASERCVDPWKTPLHFAIDRYLARRSARIVANSQGVCEFYVQHGLPAEKMVVIPNAVLPPPPVATTRDELLAELGLPADIRLVAVVGRLWPQKRVKDALWAADTLKVLRGDVHLLVIGDGPDRARLVQFARDTEVIDRVHFLGHRDDVPRILPHLDALWSPSAYEGQSNAILEAMAAGVPVIASDIPGTRELVVHETTGFLVPTTAQDLAAPTVNRPVAHDLTRLTVEILNDPPRAKRLGEAARARILAEFSLERMVERYTDLYRQLFAE